MTARCQAVTQSGSRCAFGSHVLLAIDGELIEVCRTHHAYYAEWVQELGRDLANRRLGIGRSKA
jgi:hypothetical protein